MKFRNTLILFGVVILLFGFVYIFEIRRPEESTGKSKNLGKMLLMRKGDIDRLELTYTDPEYENIAFFNDANGQWQIERPLRANADQKIMDRLLSNTVSKNILDTLKDPLDLAEYGLDNPRVIATFHLKDGTFRTLLLGNTVPTGNYVYTKQESSPDISLVPASIVGDLTKKPLDFR